MRTARREVMGVIPPSVLFSLVMEESDQLLRQVVTVKQAKALVGMMTKVNVSTAMESVSVEAQRDGGLLATTLSGGEQVEEVVQMGVTDGMEEAHKKAQVVVDQVKALASVTVRVLRVLVARVVHILLVVVGPQAAVQAPLS